MSEVEKSILKEFISYLIIDINTTHSKSKSQLGQDFFALGATNKTGSNFFVEIGGGDPLIASNEVGDFVI